MSEKENLPLFYVCILLFIKGSKNDLLVKARQPKKLNNI